MTPVKLDFPNLVEEVDRHGNVRVYVRVKVKGRARRERIYAAVGSPEFADAYRAARQALKSGVALPKAIKEPSGYKAGSLGWMMSEYFAGDEFKALDINSQRTRRNVIEDCLREPVRPGSPLLMRDCPCARVDVTHIQMLRDRKVAAGLKGAANNRRKYVSAAFGWAIEQRRFGIVTNPCRDARKVKYVSAGFYTWTLADVAKYMEKHPLGTVAHLALCLMLFLGARRQDAIRLGPKNRSEQIVDGVPVAIVTYVPRKTRYARARESVKPILWPLAEAIRATPIGLKTFIVNEYGRPFSDGGMGNKMREWCDAAGLPECTAHGLKKIGATLCADLGATDRQLMALFDWESEQQANTYTRNANRAKLAAECAALLGRFWSEPKENKAAAV